MARTDLDLCVARWERGTLPFESIAGQHAAIEYIASLGGGGFETRREALSAGFAAIQVRPTHAIVPHSYCNATLPGTYLSVPGASRPILAGQSLGTILTRGSVRVETAEHAFIYFNHVCR